VTPLRTELTDEAALARLAGLAETISRGRKLEEEE
jgi:hypothetical protein